MAFKMKKKAQTEIIGVAVIVLILVIAGFFIFGQRLKPRKSQAGSFIDPKLAQSFLNSLMNTKTEKTVVVQDIIKDCYSNRNDLCASDNIKDCCDYASKTIKNALDATLKSWKKPYRLSIEKNNEKKIPDITYGNCNSFSEKEQPGFYYIPPPPLITVRLDICKP